MSTEAGYGIGEVAARTGIAEGTLRMWETRHGFPRPQRLPGGRRVYSPTEVDRIKAVMAGRREGLSLSAAIRRALTVGAEPEPSVYRALRNQFVHLHPSSMSKRALLWITRAIEDECAARAGEPLLIGCFQREHFYRQSEPRWKELAQSSERTIALASFPVLRTPPNAPAEVPLGAEDELKREWVVICEDDDLSACVIGRQRLNRGALPEFEVIWTVEPDVVRAAARVCVGFVATSAPSLVDDLAIEMATTPPAASASHLRTAVDLATRITDYATGATNV